MGRTCACVSRVHTRSFPISRRLCRRQVGGEVNGASWSRSEHTKERASGWQRRCASLQRSSGKRSRRARANDFLLRLLVSSRRRARRGRPMSSVELHVRRDQVARRERRHERQLAGHDRGADDASELTRVVARSLRRSLHAEERQHRALRRELGAAADRADWEDGEGDTRERTRRESAGGHPPTRVPRSAVACGTHPV